MALYPVYSETRVCVSELRAAGLSKEADALHVTLYGATSNEVMNDIWNGASRLLYECAGLPAGTRERLGRLVQAIDEARPG